MNMLKMDRVWLLLLLVLVPAWPAAAAPAATMEEAPVCDMAAFETGCATGCPGGYRFENGCPVCECQPAAPDDAGGRRAAVVCPARCRDYLPGPDGRPGCECADEQAVDPAAAVEAACDASLMDKCRTGCPLGYVVGSGGCPACACRQAAPGELPKGCPTDIVCGQRCRAYPVGPDGCPGCGCVD